jgi:hypothetical protein
MASVKRANTSGITKTGTAIPDVPDAPTIGAVTTANASASVAFTAAATGGAVTTFTATSTPGSITGTSATSPITVSGLSNGTSYTFKVKGTNSTATGPESSASSSATPDNLVFDSIATVSVGAGGTSTINFSSIPQNYTHLQVRWISRGDRSDNEYDNIALRINSDTGTNYSNQYIAGTSSIYSDTYITQNNVKVGYTASNKTAVISSSHFSAGIMDIFDYTTTNKVKTFRTFTGIDFNNGGFVVVASGLWNSTAAISTLTFYPVTPGGYSWLQNSHFALYGIKGS